MISGLKLGPIKLINKSDEKNTKKLISNNIRVKILFIELINNLLSTLFLSANKAVSYTHLRAHETS